MTVPNLRLRGKPCLISILALLWALSPAARGETPIMPVSEVQRGMRGNGLTVFSGDRIEGFDFEVLGVLKRAQVGRDFILVKLSGGPLEHTGIIAGMSGSPVFIDSRLVGAVSFGWSLSKDAIAGITPISDMREHLNDLKRWRERESWEGASSSGSSPPPSAAEEGTSGRAEPGATSAPSAPSPLPRTPRPLYLSGHTEGGRKLLEERLGPRGFTAILSPAGTSQDAGGLTTVEAAARLVGGAPMGVLLQDGDLVAAAVGTVTERIGDHVLGFGHPFVSAGPLSMPLVAADVVTVVPSYFLSFKVANAGREVGSLVWDGASGVVGRIGEPARMIPLAVHLRAPHMEGVLTRRIRVVRHPQLTLPLIESSLASILEADLPGFGEWTLEWSLDIDLPRYGRRTFRGSGTASDAPAEALGSLLETLREVLFNPFESILPKSVELSLTLRPGERIAEVQGLRVNKARFRPGETVEAVVLLRPRGGSLVSRRGRVTLPVDAQPGKLSVEVLDAGRAEESSRKRAPAMHEERTLEDVLRRLETRKDPTSLYLQVALRRRGASHDDTALPSLPGSFFALLEERTQTGFGPLQEALEVELPTPWHIEGGQEMTIQVYEDGE